MTLCVYLIPLSLFFYLHFFLFLFFCCYCIESIFSFSLPNDFDIEIYGEKERTTYGNVKHYGFDYVCPHNGALIYISSPSCSYCWWYFKLFVSRQDHFSIFFFLPFIFNLLFYFVFLAYNDLHFNYKICKFVAHLHSNISNGCFLLLPNTSNEFFFVPKCFHLLFAVRQTVHFLSPYFWHRLTLKFENKTYLCIKFPRKHENCALNKATEIL